MQKITRESLIKSIIAKKIINYSGDIYLNIENYKKHLNELYHYWEHRSSQELCEEYNKLESKNITLEDLIP
jgi:hypothetical protein